MVSTPPGPPALAREIGLFGATMLVMGGIVGSGIFMNPYVVARQVGTPALILAAWGFGGLVALAGAFVYAELASLRPAVGGQYAYLREAYSPRVAFLYGWALLLVTQSGGMAAVAVTFARYLGELVPLPLPEAAVAVLALATLTGVNCLGVRAGNDVQSLLMVLKTVAILGLVAVGFVAFGGERVALRPVLDRPPSLGLLAAFGAALVPVLFAYGGWQTSGFVMGELKRPERDMPRALLLGVAGVVVLYLSVNVVCLRALGAEGLAASTAPASDVMRLALGERGARLIAVGIAISTFGFLAQGILTAPAGLLRDGPRRRLLRPRRAARPAHARAGAGDRAAGSRRRRHRALGPVRADPELRGVGGLHRHGAHRGRSLRLPAARRGGELPGAGPPVDDRLLRAVVLARRGRHHPPLPGRQCDRAGHPRPRPARLPPVEGPVSPWRQALTPPFSEYMEWAKTRSAARFNLASSGVVAFPLAELGARIEDLEICGPSAYGYAPLQERLARKAGVDPDRVVHATGTSMANLLVLAAAAEAGDVVLIEEPTYSLLVDAARWLRLDVRRFPRRAEEGFRLDPREVERALTPRTRLVVLTNLHNPSSAFVPPEDLRAVGEAARSVGARVLVDEVYLETLAVRGRPSGSAAHLGPEFVVTSSLTKAYGLSGLRCGWAVADPDLARRMWRLDDLFGVIPAHPAERLSVVALDHLDRVGRAGPAHPRDEHGRGERLPRRPAGPRVRPGRRRHDRVPAPPPRRRGRPVPAAAGEPRDDGRARPLLRGAGPLPPGPGLRPRDPRRGPGEAGGGARRSRLR